MWQSGFRIDNMAKKNDKKKIDFKHNLREYWAILKNYKKLLIFLIINVILVELMQVIPKFLFKEIIDKGTLFVGRSLEMKEFVFILIIVAVLYTIGNIVQMVSFWFRSHLTAQLEVKMMAHLKEKYFKHILNLDYSFHVKQKTGSLISKIGRGSDSIERITNTITYNFLPFILQITIVGFSLIYFSLASSIVVGITALSFILFSFFVQQAQQSAKLEANDAEDLEKGNISDVFTNIESIKYFGKEFLIRRKFRDFVLNTKKANLKYWEYYRWLEAGQVFIVTVGTLFLLYFPIVKFLAGGITLGTIVFIYTIYVNLIGSMWNFVGGIQEFYRSMANFQSLFDYGKIPRNIEDKAGARVLKINKGAIEFRDIDFKYKKRKIFQDFNLKIEANKKIAFVGHSGCGKSTLINLLYRFYDVEKGAVLIDGEDIRDFKQESLRSAMSIVPQECVLFDDSIWNNIKFSNPKATKDEIKKAIRFAQLEKIIAEMPEKEKTIVGERGVKLSGGEKQRVSIARAILANKKILVLDEATSALDSETEFEIQKSLAKLMKGRTSIIIAHRLSTIMHADKIVVMKKGKIIEVGTHDELIGKRGEYRRFWGLQKGGYIK